MSEVLGEIALKRLLGRYDPVQCAFTRGRQVVLMALRDTKLPKADIERRLLLRDVFVPGAGGEGRHDH